MRRLPAVLAAIAGTLNWRRHFLVVTVTGSSMQPALQPGDRLLVRRTRLDRIRSGQVAVLRQPPGGKFQARPDADSADGLLIKRIAAVPGDRIPESCQALPDMPLPDYVPPGSFIMLGDNPGSSYDSRFAGLIPADLLFGTAIRRLGGGTRHTYREH